MKFGLMGNRGVWEVVQMEIKDPQSHPARLRGDFTKVW